MFNVTDLAVNKILQFRNCEESSSSGGLWDGIRTDEFFAAFGVFSA